MWNGEVPGMFCFSTINTFGQYYQNISEKKLLHLLHLQNRFEQAMKCAWGVQSKCEANNYT